MDNGQEKNERGHSFTVEGAEVVVEYYHFGEDVAYEYAAQLRFDSSGQAQMVTALDLPSTTNPQELSAILKNHFRTYDCVRDYADANGVDYDVKTDFQPRIFNC